MRIVVDHRNPGRRADLLQPSMHSLECAQCARDRIQRYAKGAAHHHRVHPILRIVPSRKRNPNGDSVDAELGLRGTDDRVKPCQVIRLASQTANHVLLYPLRELTKQRSCFLNGKVVRRHIGDDSPLRLIGQ